VVESTAAGDGDNVKPTNIDTKPRRRVLLTPKQASEYLGVPTGTLCDWRSQRRGPDFFKLGGYLVRYAQNDLDAWLAAQHVSLPQQTNRRTG
jgi:predicted DNA-binding transcriptional regulator AlpA